MILTLSQLQTAMPYAPASLPAHLSALNDAMVEFKIDTLLTQAIFLAQVAHETVSLTHLREIASGADYEGRLELGNIYAGDGKRFPGRGDLMITGRTNTLRCLAALGRPQEDTEYLETPVGAARSAGWFWVDHGLNASAELGNFADNTRKLNGGYNGMNERIKHYIRARKALGI